MLRPVVRRIASAAGFERPQAVKRLDPMGVVAWRTREFIFSLSPKGLDK